MIHKTQSLTMRDDDPGHGQCSDAYCSGVMEHASEKDAQEVTGGLRGLDGEWADAEYQIIEDTISLFNWNNEQPISYLWYCGVGHPAGFLLRLNTETSGDEECCDFAKLDILKQIWHLRGTVDRDDTWNWDGEGNPTDEKKNTIFNINARRC